MSEKDKTSGGNGKPSPEEKKPKSVREMRDAALRARKSQYFFLLLVEILDIQPAIRENCALFFEIDKLVYDMGEVFEKAVARIKTVEREAGK